MRSRPRAKAATAAAVVALVVAQPGCAFTGSYEPRPSPRIAPLDAAGSVYVRDGRRYDLGNLGSAEDLVRGNDLAVAEARASHRKAIAGWALYGTGVGMFAAGIIVNASRDDDTSRDDTRAVTVLILGSVVPLLMSIPFLAGAATSRQNAVNIYNDGLEGPIDPHAFDEPRPPGGR